ncbi:MAG: phage holin family protein [Chitinophagaceae bacterium]
MLKFVSKTILTSVAILVAAYLLKGVEVDNTITAILVAATLGFLNSFVRPILIVLTIPITMVTLGLFLILINVLIVYWVTKLVPGFKVESFGWAVLFSLIVSIVSGILERFINKFDANREEE